MVPTSTFLAWREGNRSFEDLAAYVDHLCDGNLATGAQPVRLDRCAEVTANFFSLLGVEPAMGRDFRPGEDRAGAPKVMMLSNGFWRLRFGADPGVLGRALRLDNSEYIVVGVLPPHFEYPGDLKPDAFVPMELPAKPAWAASESEEMEDVNVAGRLKAGVTLEQARGDIQALMESLAREYPAQLAEKLAGAEPRMMLLHERRVPLEAGRFFGDEDREDTAPVAIVSREFAQRYLRPGDAVGRRLGFAATESKPARQFTIVGDVRYFGLDRQIAPAVFTSTTQFPVSALTLAVRTRGIRKRLRERSVPRWRAWTASSPSTTWR